MIGWSQNGDDRGGIQTSFGLFPLVVRVKHRTVLLTRFVERRLAINVYMYRRRDVNLGYGASSEGVRNVLIPHNHGWWLVPFKISLWSKMEEWEFVIPMNEHIGKNVVSCVVYNSP